MATESNQPGWAKKKFRTSSKGSRAWVLKINCRRNTVRTNFHNLNANLWTIRKFENLWLWRGETKSIYFLYVFETARLRARRRWNEVRPDKLCVATYFHRAASWSTKVEPSLDRAEVKKPSADWAIHDTNLKGALHFPLNNIAGQRICKRTRKGFAQVWRQLIIGFQCMKQLHISFRFLLETGVAII